MPDTGQSFLDDERSVVWPNGVRSSGDTEIIGGDAYRPPYWGDEPESLGEQPPGDAPW
jgi:hypothetical protein